MFSGPSALSKFLISAVGAVHTLTNKPSYSIITLYNSNAIKASSQGHLDSQGHTVSPDKRTASILTTYSKIATWINYFLKMF